MSPLQPCLQCCVAVVFRWVVSAILLYDSCCTMESSLLWNKAVRDVCVCVLTVRDRGTAADPCLSCSVLDGLCPHVCALGQASQHAAMSHKCVMLP